MMRMFHFRFQHCFAALLADLLSLFRLGVALVIIWLGWRHGSHVLPQVILLVTLGWMSDGLDGSLARRSACSTRMGRFDYPLDVALTWAEFAYATLAGFISPVFFVLYSSMSIGVSFWLWRKAVLVLFMRGIDAMMLFLALRYAPYYLLPLILWLFVLAIIYRERMRSGIPRWIRELSLLVSHRKEA